MFQKILILVIVCVTIFIIHQLLKARQSIKVEEGFGEDEINRIKGNGAPIAISSLKEPKYLDLPLREFIVKSSYNSAISGDYANQEMIRYVMGRGCRLLDFEIFTVGNIEYVSLSKDDQLSMDTLNESQDRLSLANALATVNSIAFTAPCPSPNDPLFLSLRMKNKLKGQELKTVYKRVADILSVTFPNRMFQDSTGKALEVNGSTPLKDIMGKVVVIFDTENKLSNFDKLCSGSSDHECAEIYPLINIPANVAGGLPIYRYEDVIMKLREPVLQERDGVGTTIDTFFMVVPPVDDVIQVPAPREVILSSFPQFMLYKFHINNSNLEEYENIFNKAGSALVPISSLLTSREEDLADANDDEVVPSAPKKPAGPLRFN